MPRTRLTAIREEAGISQRDMAARLGVDENTISRIERWDSADPNRAGTIQPKYEHFVAYAEACGVAPGRLLGDGLDRLVNEVEPVSEMASLRIYRVVRSRLNELPHIRAGEMIYVDPSAARIDGRKAGDVLLIEIGRSVDECVLMLWQHVPPKLLVTNRPGSNLVLHMDDARFTIRIVGVVHD